MVLVIFQNCGFWVHYSMNYKTKKIHYTLLALYSVALCDFEMHDNPNCFEEERVKVTQHS